MHCTIVCVSHNKFHFIFAFTPALDFSLGSFLPHFGSSLCFSSFYSSANPVDYSGHDPLVISVGNERFALFSPIFPTLTSSLKALAGIFRLNSFFAFSQLNRNSKSQLWEFHFIGGICLFSRAFKGSFPVSRMSIDTHFARDIVQPSGESRAES